ncbi:MAG: hypothetical protein LBV34_09885 [Nocardiopsaceae bacterium]|jgi:hypothetical protein|nr:hypothetical protein [Nocardiopsaceae bacterium]
MTLLTVPVGDGSGAVIEVQVPPAEVDRMQERGVVLAAPGERGAQVAAFSLASAADKVMPALRAVAGRLREGVHAPDELTLAIGLQIGGETGFYFAKGTADASIAVTMTWRRGAKHDAPEGQPTESAGAP